MTSSAPRGPSPAHWQVRRLPPGDLTTRDLAAWADLESRAAEPNAYLSPHFVLPALRHLDRGAHTSVYLIDRVAAGGRETVGAGVLCRERGSRFLPLPHLIAYRCEHSYLSGLLLDRAWTGEALSALLEQLRALEPLACGLELPMVWTDGPLARAALQDPARGAVLFPGVEQDERAILVLAEACPELIQRALGSHRKDTDRRMRRLRERGEVQWRWHRGDSVPAALDAFLALEHAGWKGEEGTSLRSRPADEAFFREAVRGFASDGRALFTELTVNGVPIASTSNFLSGRGGFGFKIGWDPEYKTFSPGILNEVEFVRGAATAFADLEYFDSGAGAESYINRLWPSRRRMGHLIVPSTLPAKLAVAVTKRLSAMKRRVAARRKALPADGAGSVAASP
jgi:CelD/BcsL family acetyltransferase involved in cellulose biosynthesis